MSYLPAFTEKRPLNVQEHVSLVKEEHKKAKGIRTEREKESLRETMETIPPERRRAINRSVSELSTCKSSVWLSTIPYKKHGFDLSPLEFRDALTVRYKRSSVEMR
uniref:Uncharacterized protein n=1 Tax=Lygus hesperus TaxID=30085 RepID=A0A0K8SKD9_LYGHE